MSKISEAPATFVKSETVIDRPGLKVVRMDLPAGESLPSHFAPRDVVIVVTDGTGRITVENRIIAVEPGSVVEFSPGQLHGVEADEPLKIVIIQAEVATVREAMPKPILVGSTPT